MDSACFNYIRVLIDINISLKIFILFGHIFTEHIGVEIRQEFV